MSLNATTENFDLLTKEEIAAMVKNGRLDKQLTQKELADLSGINLRSLQRIENGNVQPRIYTWRLLAAHIDLTINSKPFVTDLPQPNKARKWIISISSLVILFFAFGGFVLQSPTFPETRFETFMMLLLASSIYGIILYKVWD